MCWEDIAHVWIFPLPVELYYLTRSEVQPNWVVDADFAHPCMWLSPLVIPAGHTAMTHHFQPESPSPGVIVRAVRSDDELMPNDMCPLLHATALKTCFTYFKGKSNTPKMEQLCLISAWKRLCLWIVGIETLRIIRKTSLRTQWLDDDTLLGFFF